jgi:hypothetical protein
MSLRQVVQELQIGGTRAQFRLKWNAGSISYFDAFFFTRTGIHPDQVRGRLSLENALNQRHFSFGHIAFDRPRPYIWPRGLNVGHDDDR